MPFPGSVTADAQTPDVPGTGDFSDDPAILIHPTTPANSVLVTSNKDYTNGGIYTYSISTTPTLTDTEDSGTAFNNVDLRYNLGSLDNVIGATNREAGTIDFFTYDFAATSDEMSSVGSISTGFTNEPYGFAMGRLATSTGEKFYAFASEDNGSTVKQWELTESAGVVSGTLVRTITVPNSSQVEGIVVDDVSGDLYIAEEDYGIYKYGTDPASGSTHTTVDTVSGGNLTADVEGMSIYYGDNGTGYLIASSQFESKYAVYELQGSNTYLGKFSISGNGSTIDGVTKTDGLDVTNVNLGTTAFDEGLFVAHDGENTSNDSSNFKLVEFDEIANLGGLTLDTSSYDPRAVLPVTAPTAPAWFSINTTDASTITYTGTSGNDTLTGTSAPELFDGLGGDDTYHGGTGDDQYRIAQAGDVIASDTGGQDTVELFYAGNYTMSSNMEHVIVQGSTNRTVTGNADDNIMTAAGTTSGTMTFIGGAGDDNIRVGTRDVAATGGADNDLFRYSVNAVGDGNTISDFTWGEDLLDLSAAVASSTAPTVDPFTNGVLSLVNSGLNVKLMYDQDGSAGGTYTSTEIVELIGVQVDAGINQAHVYTGL